MLDGLLSASWAEGYKMRIAVGMRCVDRQPATVFRTIESVQTAGLGDDLTFFVDGPFAAKETLEKYGLVIQRPKRIGAWPNYFLSLAELYLRQPKADLYLLLEDDILVCRDVAAYLQRHYRRLGVASLFTSARVERRIAERGVGFQFQDPGWHVSSGGQAWVFSSERLRQFLASDFVVNYRKNPPQDLDRKHYRRDGLSHTDCVVGRFAREAGCGIQYHFPSLVQHVGEESFMYPGFQDKRDARFSDRFPGEEFSALSLLGKRAAAEAEPEDCVVLVVAREEIDPRCQEELRKLEEAGYEVRRMVGEWSPDQARNQLASAALLENYGETLWIDGDIRFSVNHVKRIRAHQLPLCAGVYPQPGKRKFACEFLPETREIALGSKGGLLEVQLAEAGFLHVRREVYQAIQRKLKLPACSGTGMPLYPFFQPLVDVSESFGTRYLPPDYAFCARAREAGFTIMADTGFRLYRAGSHAHGWEEIDSPWPRYANYQFKVK